MSRNDSTVYMMTNQKRNICNLKSLAYGRDWMADLGADPQVSVVDGLSQLNIQSTTSSPCRTVAASSFHDVFLSARCKSIFNVAFV